MPQTPTPSESTQCKAQLITSSSTTTPVTPTGRWGRTYYHIEQLHDLIRALTHVVHKLEYEVHDPTPTQSTCTPTAHMIRTPMGNCLRTTSKCPGLRNAKSGFAAAPRGTLRLRTLCSMNATTAPCNTKIKRYNASAVHPGSHQQADAVQWSATATLH